LELEGFSSLPPLNCPGDLPSLVVHALTFAFSLTTFNKPQVRRGLHPEE